jgi:hypothetical protein
MAYVIEIFSMMSRIFLGLLGVFAVLVAFFTYYSWSWLQSIGMPTAAVAGYMYYDNIAWILLIVSAVILLIFGNVILWLSRRAWALWSTLLYFVVFILLRYFLLNPAFFEFRRSNGMSDDSYSAAPLLGALIIIVSAIFIFCDQFAVLQLQRTMYPLTTDLEPGIIEVPDVNDAE